MKRRAWLGLGSLVSIAILSGVAIFFVLQARERQQRAILDAIGIASGEFGKTLTESFSMQNLTLDRLAKLDGVVTSLTLTFTNPGPRGIKNIVIEGLTLGREQPRERGELPLRISGLAPGASHRVVLHYDQLKWIDDSVAVNVIDISRATKPFDYKESYVLAGETRPGSQPGVKVNIADSNKSTQSTGIPTYLDEADARALKQRRDAALKLKP
jgi:hypothetical protein